eukprot:COSAG02_NODE_555_length_20407_cov_11.072878_19_plen_151_part_00
MDGLDPVSHLIENITRPYTQKHARTHARTTTDVKDLKASFHSNPSIHSTNCRSYAPGVTATSAACPSGVSGAAPYGIGIIVRRASAKVYMYTWSDGRGHTNSARCSPKPERSGELLATAAAEVSAAAFASASFSALCADNIAAIVELSSA